MKKSNKTIVLGESNCSLGYLKRTLNTCGDNARLKIKLCVDEDREDDHTVKQLRNLSSRLYSCLNDARICIEKLAEEEKKKDTNLIYYDKFRGFNGGARDLLMVVDNLLDNYSREMVQIDLER
jgi:hypothetical protein